MSCCCNNNTRQGCSVCPDKMLIRATRIYDGAKLSTHSEDVLTLTGFEPSSYTPPLTFVSARFSGEATITSQSVTPLANSPRSRVRLTYSYPVTVTYTDAAGVRGTASGSLSSSVDLIMFIPDKQYSLEVSVAYDSRIGTIEIADGTVTATVNSCTLSIIRVLVRCEVLICPKGCAEYPDAILTEDLVCSAVQSSDI